MISATEKGYEQLRNNMCNRELINATKVWDDQLKKDIGNSEKMTQENENECKQLGNDVNKREKDMSKLKLNMRVKEIWAT